MKFFLKYFLVFLLFLQLANANSLPANATYIPAPKPLSFLEGLNYCLDLNARILSIDELRWLYEHSTLNALFKQTIYWSGSFEELQSAYAIHFKTGLIFIDFQSNKHFVMCVKTS